ncbi:MAG TPA: gliding motility-associated C-terminal domain-containing protein [Candidatus Babeliaceae bacterium]|nr:gliding motility-associated C-terminal domain-containing protein [Candidatus Babeliaceae bacterium]
MAKSLKAICAFLLLLLFFNTSDADPCLTNTLIVNTGYDPITNTAIAPGTNGGTPITDPHWIISYISPDITTAIASTPPPALTEVTVGNEADVIQKYPLYWTSNPPGDPGGWISCVNSNQYNDNGSSNYSFNLTFSRNFRMCSNDSIIITLFLACDDAVTALDVDGISQSFSQPTPPALSNFTGYTSFTRTLYLTAGTHSINISTVNTPFIITNPGESGMNQSGLNVYGTVSSATGSNSIVSESSTACNAYVCDSNSSPCLSDTVVINTGYNPITNTAIAPSANGGTPVTDPHWIVSSISSDITTAIANTSSPSLTEVTAGEDADVIATLPSLWAANPANYPGGWISCVNANGYYDNGSPQDFNMTLSRSFRMCNSDTIKFTLFLASDNYISTVDVDGAILPFSQPSAPPTASNFNSFTPFTYILYLTAGTHSINIKMYNATFSQTNPGETGINQSGLNVYGTVTSATGSNSLVSESSTACNNYVCNSVIDTSCNTLSLPDSLSTCAGGSVTLQATVTGPDSVASVVWSPAQGLSNPNILDPICTPGNNSADYQVVIKSIKSDGDTCTISGSVYVKVASLAPVITIQQPNNCQGQVSLIASDLNNASSASYSWNFGDNSSDTGTTVTHVYADTGMYTVVLTESTAGGCSDTTSVSVHITALSNVKINATGDTTICQGAKAPLGASGGVTYTWIPAGTLNSATIANPIAKPDSTTTYIVTGKDSSGCIGTDSVTVSILPAPILKIDSPQIVDCSNRSIQLNASGAMKYRWEPAASFNNPDIADPVVTPTTTTTFYLTGYNAAGCAATDSVLVTVEQEGDVVMPNAFTPNGDGKNDVIYPITYCDFTFESFSIYNRWGQRVFFTNKYMDGWDGTFNGVPQPLDVYVYYVTGHVTGTTKQVLHKGNITLIR